MINTIRLTYLTGDKSDVMFKMCKIKQKLQKIKIRTEGDVQIYKLIVNEFLTTHTLNTAAYRVL